MMAALGCFCYTKVRSPASRGAMPVPSVQSDPIGSGALSARVAALEFRVTELEQSVSHQLESSVIDPAGRQIRDLPAGRF